MTTTLDQIRAYRASIGLDPDPQLGPITREQHEQHEQVRIVDLFAGPGGWDHALQRLGRDDVLGIEWDDAACQTRIAAGLRTRQGDVAAIDPSEYAGIDGLIASPPCQAWSMAGNRGGVEDRELVVELAERIGAGEDRREAARAEATDERSLLVVEPIRWALALRPRWIACEQVPPVLELWETFAPILERAGYSTWTGILRAEQFGVPQTRQRAILIARLDGIAEPPTPTHRRYLPPRRDDAEAIGLFDLPEREAIVHPDDRGLLPWVSMAEALGWAGGELTYLNGTHAHRAERPDTAPAPTLHFGGRANGVSWAMRANAQSNAAVRDLDEPAPTIKGGHDYNVRQWIPAQWTRERPATSVLTTDRISRPGHRDREGGERQFVDAVRVTEAEAAVLQGFPAAYPWQGNKGKRFEQIGNAVPPPLAAAVLEGLLEPIVTGEQISLDEVIS